MFFGKESKYKFSKKEQVKLEVCFERRSDELRIHKIIDHGENAVGGKKPLVFDFADVLVVETIPLTMVKRKCDWEK
jgi:hypothetical protein